MTTIYWTGSNDITYSSTYDFGTQVVTSDGTTNSPDLSGGVNTLQLSGDNTVMNPGDTISVDIYANGVFSSNLGSFQYLGSITVAGVNYPLITTGAGYQVYGIVLPAGGFVANTADPFTCYLRGTHIMTANGPQPIENLQPGDLLITRFGPLRPLKFLGRQSFSGTFLRRHGAPVRIAAGALGPDLPCRDLFVSPDHSMLIDDRLVQAKLLINGVSITQTATSDRVDYFHIDLGVHDCVIAEGTWSESYAEMGNRAKFHNAAEFDAAFPDHRSVVQPMCCPQVQGDGAELPDIRAAIMARLPAEACSDQADLHVLADGRRIDAGASEDAGMVFDIPPATHTVQLISHATSPALMGWNADARRLGVNLLALTGRIGRQTRKLRLDDPAFSVGCYKAERMGDQVTRWTDGAADIPLARFGFGRQGFQLVVACAQLPAYLVTPPAMAA